LSRPKPTRVAVPTEEEEEEEEEESDINSVAPCSLLNFQKDPRFNY